jgi:hypothetical protein
MPVSFYRRDGRLGHRLGIRAVHSGPDTSDGSESDAQNLEKSSLRVEGCTRQSSSILRRFDKGKVKGYEMDGLLCVLGNDLKL